MDLLRKDTAKQYRGIRKLLHGNPPLDPPPVDYDGWYVGSIGLIFIALLLLIIASCVHPTPGLTYEVNDRNAIKAVIGEAENQGYKGMLYVACSIRNRASLKDVYGLYSPRVEKHLYSEHIYKVASKAWYDSQFPENCTPVKGAVSWEDTKAFGEPFWAKSMRLVLVYKDHKFYAKN